MLRGSSRSNPVRRPGPGTSVCLPALVVVLVSICLASCGSGSAQHDNTLRIALYGDPGVPDPARASSASSVFLDSLLFSGLVKFGPDLHVIPELAVSMPTISNDGRTYTFTVRDNARFKDGQPCTAHDIAYSLARALSPQIDSPQARYYLGGIEGADAVEAGKTLVLSGVRPLQRRTVQIRLSRPDASFLEKLAMPWASVVERSHQEPGSAIQPSGTGPWVLAQRARGGTLTLRPRPHFYGNSLQVKSLVLVSVASATRAMQLYRKGALDVVYAPVQEYPALSTRPDFHQSASLDAYYAVPGPGDGVALATSLDRDMLIRDTSPALSALDTIVPPAVPDYVSSAPDMDAPSGTPSDPQPAGSVSLSVSPPHDLLGAALARALARQWSVVRRGGLPVTLLHAWAMLPDPSLWLALLWSRTQSSWFRATLVHAAGLTNDPVSRMSSYSSEERWALTRGLIIPLASGSIAYLVKPAVQSLQVTPLGIMPENNNWSQVSVTER